MGLCKNVPSRIMQGINMVNGHLIWPPVSQISRIDLWNRRNYPLWALGLQAAFRLHGAILRSVEHPA